MPYDLTKLRAAIVAAVPEIVELKFGCEVTGFSGVLGRTFYLDHYEDSEEWWMSVRPENYEDITNRPIYTVHCVKPSKFDYRIIGRPITLPDVLRAIEEAADKIEVLVRADGGILVSDFAYRSLSAKVLWDLTKDLDGQSDECKRFLEEIICKEPYV